MSSTKGHVVRPKRMPRVENVAARKWRGKRTNRDLPHCLLGPGMIAEDCRGSRGVWFGVAAWRIREKMRRWFAGECGGNWSIGFEVGQPTKRLFSVSDAGATDKAATLSAPVCASRRGPKDPTSLTDTVRYGTSIGGSKAVPVCFVPVLCGISLLVSLPPLSSSRDQLLTIAANASSSLTFQSWCLSNSIDLAPTHICWGSGAGC
jgi:hypothetical protein